MNNPVCAVPGCGQPTTVVNRHIYTGGAPEARRLCEQHDKLYWRLMGMRLQPTLTMLANPPAHETQEEGDDE